MTGSRRTATRVTLGAMSLSSSNHFAPIPYSAEVKPVALPPGRAKLATKPAPTGSGVCVNTIGTERVTCSNGPAADPPEARMTSGSNATNSIAYLRLRSASPAPQRVSIRTLPPSVQPNCCSACVNAMRRGAASGSSAARLKSTLIRRTRLASCARAATGHATAAPPMSVMNSRRFTALCLPCFRQKG